MQSQIREYYPIKTWNNLFFTNSGKQGQNKNIFLKNEEKKNTHFFQQGGPFEISKNSFFNLIKFWYHKNGYPKLTVWKFQVNNSCSFWNSLGLQIYINFESQGDYLPTCHNFYIFYLRPHRSTSRLNCYCPSCSCSPSSFDQKFE